MELAKRIKSAFDPYFELPEEAWRSFSEKGEVVEIARETILKKAGDTERYLYFILEGSGGILLWHRQNFVCVDICYENDFFGDYMSFLTQSGSPLEVIVFEPSVFFRISKAAFDGLNQNNPLSDKICRFASEGLFIHKQKQQIDILTKTAKERYGELLQRQPEIIRRTPMKYIASYLGVTPQSLSRIRKDIFST